MKGPGFKYIVQKRVRAIGSLRQEEVEIYREVFEEYGIYTRRTSDEFGRMKDGTVVLVDLGEVSLG
jgi:phosphoribosylaminoimidazole-succinocarboxamide synthase